VAINSLWFWGGGPVPDHVTANHPTLYSDDALLHGLARVGTLQAMPLQELADTTADALFDLRNVRDSAGILDRWLQPACLRAARQMTVLDFADGQVFTLAPAQRWRFWRRPLARLAT